uniref:Putative basic tail protein n=1 Tax=Ixodes ricinus TaxID=34613 RepID=A0A0K8RIX8_IXORI
MELKTMLFVQIAAFMVLGIQLLAAGSEVQAKTGSKDDGIYVHYCGNNCTHQDKRWTGCSKDCKCVYEGDNSQGICISISYLGDYPDLNLNDPELTKAAPRPPKNSART